MKLYIARHGQSEANKVGIAAGSQDDTPLTDEGWEDAARLAKNIGTFKGLIVSSPLHRAQQTAAYVRDQLAPGEPIRIDEDFVERDMGNATDKPREEYLSMEASGVPIAGAETPEQMFVRIKHGLETIIASGQDTLLVAHDGAYRMIVCILNHLAPEDFVRVPVPKNGEYHVFEL